MFAGRATELERDVPFALWVEALGAHVLGAAAEALSGLEEEQLADLAVALPAVARVSGVAPAPTVERHRVARAVRALLEGLAATRPVTLLLDDVHWADPASGDAIALLLHRPPSAGVLFALAARTGRAPGVEDALHTAARHDGAKLLEVEALSREAADLLLPAALGPATRARLYEQSGGNPFYLQALTGSGVDAAGAPVASVGARVPRGVVAALVAEVSALAPAARLLVQGAAVAGDPFEVSLAAAASGVPEHEALAALDGVLAADLVRPTDRPRRFRFRHPLVRRAVYETAGGGWRLAAHARAASALAASGTTPAERAHHVERAARPGDLAAVELLALAAEQTAPAAPATAAGWYEAAARSLPDLSEHEERRVGLLRAQGLALLAAGRATEARDVLRRVLAMLPAEAAAERVAVAVVLGELEALWTNNAHEARRLLEAERAALGDGESGLSAALTLVLVRERAVHGDHAAAESLADQAQAAARGAGDAALEAEAAATAADEAHCRLRRDDPDELALVDRKIARAGALVDALADERVAERPQMLFWLAVARYFTGGFEPARAAAERGLRVARRSGQGLYAPAFVLLRGWVDAELGRLDAAEADAEEALESALLSGNLQVAYWSSIVLSRTALARGRVDAALEHGRAAWEKIGIIEYSQAGYAVADARLAAGDPRGALAALEAFGWVQPALWTLDRLKTVDVAVRVLLAPGRLDEADAFAQRAPAEGGGRRANPDIMSGGGGRDQLAGGAGDDLFRSPSPDGADDYHGGPDRDAIDYFGRNQPLVIELNNVDDDGERNERDNVRSNVENLNGGSAGDVLRSLGAFSRLDGRGGDDFLFGDAGPDALIGGPGVDNLNAGDGNDIVDSRDGQLDTIDCGDAIDSDTLVKYGQERRVDGCEDVQIGTLRLVPKQVRTEVDEIARMRLSWRHPHAWRQLRAIELRLTQDEMPVGEITIRPRGERITDDGAVTLVRRGTRLMRRGKTVAARLALRLDQSLAGQTLEAEVEATDRRGRRQLERDAGRIRVSG